MKKRYCIIFLWLIASACNPFKPSLVNNWATNNVRYLNAGDSLYEYPKSPSNNFLYSFTGSSPLNLNADQTFTSLGYDQHFFYGKWVLSTDQNTLTFVSAADTCRLQIIERVLNKLTLKGKVIGYFNIDSGRVARAKAMHRPDTLIKTITINIDNDYPSDKDYDYLALKNNLWRIKPVTPETPAQINKRIVGSIRFTIMYLTAHQHDPVIPLEPIALPITLASNGIQIWPENDGRVTWKDYFYDDNDAATAYHILNWAMYGSYNIPNNKHHVALDIDLLKQLLSNVK